jgi:hypothetical protein
VLLPLRWGLRRFMSHSMQRAERGHWSECGRATSALFLGSLTNRAQAKTPSAVVALVGGRVIASADADPVDDVTVLIQGGRISSVGPRDRVAVPAGARTIDCRNLALVAGFQNSHVHFTEEQWADAGSQPAPRLARQLGTMLTAYGFSTVVDIGSLLPNTVALRRRIGIDKVPGPRILTAGLPLYPPNNIPYYLKDGLPAYVLKSLPQPSNPPGGGVGGHSERGRGRRYHQAIQRFVGDAPTGAAHAG